MARRQFALPAALIIALTAGYAQVPTTQVPLAQVSATSTIETFHSATFTDIRQLLAGESPKDAVEVRANLRFPDERKDRYPAVVIVHTIAGYLEANEGRAAAALRKSGFATLTYDSFASRGMTGLASRSGRGTLPSGTADAYAALALLTGHPRIDASRIAIAGFSFGGEVARLTALEPLRAALRQEQRRFAAHVAFYPAGVFGAVAMPGAYTGAPILMLLGERDDNLPVGKIADYLAYARAEGASPPIEVVTYTGAYHAWTVPGVMPLRFYPEYTSTKRCPLILLAPNRLQFLVNRQAAPFEPNEMGACIREAPGYSMLFDEAIDRQSMVDAVTFLTKILKP
jgi:dienelactone hydrolase